MKFDVRIKSILLALLGCACIGMYFWMVSNSKIISTLHQEFSKERVLELAEQAYLKSEFADYDMTKKVQLNLNRSLLDYAQLRSLTQDSSKFLPIASWEITWVGEVETKDGIEDLLFSLSYDFQGNLIGQNRSSPNLKRAVNFKDDDAYDAALKYLDKLGIDTASLLLKKRNVNKEKRVRHFDFSFGKSSLISADLNEIYEIHITGRNVTDYRARVIVDSNGETFSSIDKTSRTVAIISTFATWFIIGIFILVIFVRKIRHDELEFKRALWLAGAVLVIMWLMVAIGSWPAWDGIIIGGAISGTLCGLGFLIIYSVAESLNRDIWPEKIEQIDILFRGFFRITEFGKSILDAVFIAGVSLLAIGSIQWLAGVLKFGYVTIGSGSLWMFGDDSAIAVAFLKNMIITPFIVFTLFSFWLTFLWSKVQNKTFLVILFAIFVNLAGLHLSFMKPPIAAFIFLLPVAFLWSYFSIKFNVISILLSFFFINILDDLPLLSIIPNGLMTAPGIISLVFVFMLLLAGSSSVFGKRSVEDFAHYVPAYVSRIAERERFLKELEIARNVQMRFLPQSTPNFPNLEIASICRPAMEVGGDYYDFIQNGQNCLGIVIGDVSGKGISAAFYMTMAKGIIKTLSKSSNSPKKILSEMNIIFYENAPRDIFISMIYGLFDMDKRVLRFARAGHNPLIVRKNKSDAPEFVKPKGLAIGLEKGPIFSQTIEEKTIHIEPDDTFVFFTDGISESMNTNGDEFGEDNLQRVIGDNGNCSAQKLIDTVSQVVTKFAGKAVQHDDFTMVVVRVNG